MPDVHTSERTRGSHRRHLALDSTVIGGLALLILAVVYRLWDAHLAIPFSYLGPNRSPLVYAPDAPFYLMMDKGAIDHGWFLTIPSLGYPFGQSLHDIPQGLDNLNLLVLQVLGWVFGNPFMAVNVFFLLTFVGIAVAAYLVLRRLGVSRLTGAAVALLYTFLPYHFAAGRRTCCCRPTGWCRSRGCCSSRSPRRSRRSRVDRDDGPRDWKVSFARQVVGLVPARVRGPRVHRFVLRRDHAHAARRPSSSSTTSPAAAGGVLRLARSAVARSSS